MSNLKFGKLDIGRYPKEGQQFRINTHPMSKQIPSISVFKGGVQVNRRPSVGSNSRVIPFVFSEVKIFKKTLKIYFLKIN